jgi:hypothetical protein
MGSSSPRPEGSFLLDSRHFLYKKAVGRKAKEERRPVGGEAMEVRRIADGGPR